MTHLGYRHGAPSGAHAKPPVQQVDIGDCNHVTHVTPSVTNAIRPNVQIRLRILLLCPRRQVLGSRAQDHETTILRFSPHSGSSGRGCFRGCSRQRRAAQHPLHSRGRPPDGWHRRAGQPAPQDAHPRQAGGAGRLVFAGLRDGLDGGGRVRAQPAHDADRPLALSPAAGEHAQRLRRVRRGDEGHRPKAATGPSCRG